MRKTIDLFMWGYQTHFRWNVEYCMNSVMEELGVLDAGAECLLVGARAPDSQNINEVCVEPEVGKWSLGLFDGLLAAVESEVAEHPLQNMYYGDEPSMRDKPENIRRTQFVGLSRRLSLPLTRSMRSARLRAEQSRLTTTTLRPDPGRYLSRAWA